jgi:hypothetical protein
VDVYALSTPTQMILAWTLLGILLTWLGVFAAMAFRLRPFEHIETDDVPTPAGSFPSISVQAAHPQQNLAPVSAHVAGTYASVTNTETTRDVGATSRI